MSLEKGGLDSEMDSVDAPATVEMLVPTPAYPFLSPPARPDEIGRLGNYRVLRLLNQGGMAFVFLAEDRDLKRKVALKVMKPSVADDLASTQRFLREARLLASIKHEHVVTVYQVSQESPTIFLAMELLRGQTLEDRINTYGPPEPDEIIRIAREISCGLDVIHCNGLIHRDLKPNNIWVEEPRQHVKLLDFGLVRAISDDNKLTGAGFVIGTPGYMSPEQARGYPLDPRSDLFSLGAVLYFACTGRQPFESDSSVGTLTSVVLDQPKHVCELNPRIPRLLGDLVMDLLEKLPANRPSSAEEVILRTGAIRKIETSNQTELVPCEVPAKKKVGSDSDKTEQIISYTTLNQSRRPTSLSRRKKIVLMSSAIGCCLLVAIMLSFGGSKKQADSILITELNAKEPVRNVSSSKKRADAVPLSEPTEKESAKSLAYQLQSHKPIAPARSTSPGIIVLDDCDEEYQGKESYEDRLSFVSLDGTKKFRINNLNVSQDVYSSHRIATDSKHDCFWVIENSEMQIRRFDLKGKETSTIKTTKQPTAIAADPETGNIWVTFHEANRGGKTAIYSPKGELLETIEQSGSEIVYDAHTKAFWIANPRLAKYSADTHRKILNVDIRAWCVSSMAVDAKSGYIWVTTRDFRNAEEANGQPLLNKVLKFDAAGEALAEISFNEDNPKKISVDPKNGSVWVLRGRKSLEHYDSKGTLIDTFQTENALTLQVEQSSGDVWIVTTDEIRRMTSKGEIVSKLRHPTRTVGAWIAAME